MDTDEVNPPRRSIERRRRDCCCGAAPAIFAALAAVMVLAGTVQAEAPWRSVRGADLPALFSDHEMADGVHFAYQFRSDGTFAGVAMGKAVQGTWRIDGNEFCWTQKRRNASEECFEAERRGGSIRLLRDGVESLSAKLTPVAKSQVPSEAPR